MTHRTSKEMYPLVERWQASQKSKKSFCEEEQIKLHTFVYWLKKYNRSEKEKNTAAVSDFVALQVDNRPVTDATSPVFAEISYPNGVALRLHKPMSSADLRSLIQL
jgi:hypothetical protein